MVRTLAYCCHEFPLSKEVSARQTDGNRGSVQAVGDMVRAEGLLGYDDAPVGCEGLTKSKVISRNLSQRTTKRVRRALCAAGPS